MNSFSWFRCWNIIKHKYLEIQYEYKNDMCTEWFVFNLATRTNCDHEGATFNIELLRLVYFSITFYDDRHQEVEEDTDDTEDETDQWNHT